MASDGLRPGQEGDSVGDLRHGGVVRRLDPSLVTGPGRHDYPRVHLLLITADVGGNSIGSRPAAGRPIWSNH